MTPLFPSLRVLAAVLAAAWAAGCQTPPVQKSDDAAYSAPSLRVSGASSYLFGWGEQPAALSNPRGGTSRGAPVTLASSRNLPAPEIAAATDSFSRDRAAILSLAGDYKVSFHFMESLGLTADHALKPPYHSWATEAVRVIANTGRFISLQHTLVMFMQEADGTHSAPMVMKHWRQDWTYEDNDLHTYRGDNVWARHRLTSDEAAGTWSQAVFQVDDSPRYEAFGRWEHRGNLTVWTGSRELRPLPRREHTVRKDYTVMEGVHRIVLTSTGWLHEQQNWKRVAANVDQSEPRYLAQELGLDRYERITAPNLTAADEYFEKTGAYWALVRKVWAEELARHDRFTLHAQSNGRRLFEEHFSQAGKFENGEPFDPAQSEKRIRSTIETFLEVPQPNNASVQGNGRAASLSPSVR